MPETSVANALRRPRTPRKTAEPGAARAMPDADAEGRIDTSYLESLLGYNARRAALAVIGVFLQRMAPYGLRPVDFSVLTLIAHNPGITSRQICAALDILPPNLVGMIKSLDKRGLIERRPHPTDRRAQGLHLSPAGRKLQKDAQATATKLERDVASRLSAQELTTLKDLLRKVYQGH
ncbi:MarR family winged helix-turn-helix transcriptional regulator [Hydrogenophaga pseudoflava]|uniref:MarR family winged helix-turn-helix transcriptional regulator n=1 Tax=Hydrogenophaga pseudoflava TaxID=47421 RepID=UPI0027E5B928|nr:MarR family transcriptional regulator [Hydrogenophaga pseudoflava]MDQ7742961.1 MarR family transcriptional regulator [Hydrogenophaga pseudoflava]